MRGREGGLSGVADLFFKPVSLAESEYMILLFLSLQVSVTLRALFGFFIAFKVLPLYHCSSLWKTVQARGPFSECQDHIFTILLGGGV